jgi:hypothetical protein
LAKRNRTNYKWPKETGQTNIGQKKQDRLSLVKRSRTDYHWSKEAGQIIIGQKKQDRLTFAIKYPVIISMSHI